MAPKRQCYRDYQCSAHLHLSTYLQRNRLKCEVEDEIIQTNQVELEKGAVDRQSSCQRLVLGGALVTSELANSTVLFCPISRLGAAEMKRDPIYAHPSGDEDLYCYGPFQLFEKCSEFLIVTAVSATCLKKKSYSALGSMLLIKSKNKFPQRQSLKSEHFISSSTMNPEIPCSIVRVFGFSGL